MRGSRKFSQAGEGGCPNSQKGSDGKFLNITKTCPCNFYPLEPHFYIVKLGFAGVYLIFLLLIKNIHCGYSLEPP